MLQTELSKRIRLSNMQLLSQKRDSFAHFTLKKDGKIFRDSPTISEDGKVFKKKELIYQLDLDQEVLASSFVLNLQKGTVKALVDKDDAFPEVLEQEMKGKKLSLKKQKDNWVVSADDIPLVSIHEGHLVELNLPTTKKIGDKFLFSRNSCVRSITCPVIEEIGNFFLVPSSCWLENLEAPHLKRVGNFFCYNAQSIKQLNLPTLEEVGDSFFFAASKLSPKTINMPCLKKIGRDFMEENKRNLGPLLLSWNEFEQKKFRCILVGKDNERS